MVQRQWSGSAQDFGGAILSKFALKSTAIDPSPVITGLDPVIHEAFRSADTHAHDNDAAWPRIKSGVMLCVERLYAKHQRREVPP